MTPSTNNGRRRRFTAIAAHIIFIVIIFVLPEVMMTVSMPHRFQPFVFHGFYIKSLVYLAAFYLNYFLIIDKTIGATEGRRRMTRFVLYNVAILIVGILICHYFNKTPARLPHRHDLPPEPVFIHNFLKSATFLLRDMVMIILSVGLAVALRLSTKWKDFDRQRRDIEAGQQAAELESLKNQLNPHFLFNSLNTIYALTTVDQVKAQAAIHRLSMLLRYVLYQDKSDVSLESEIEFIDNYVELMRLRLGDRRIEVEKNIGDAGHALVPPLIFITLIENAFKHGLTPDMHPISISIVAHDDKIVCTTVNAYTSPTEEQRSHSGIGLNNLRRRITLIYGREASLSTRAQDGVFTAKLIIPRQMP